MQDQGKRLLLAVGLALGLMLLWTVIFPTEKPKPKPATGSGSAGALLAPKKSKVGQALLAEAPAAAGSGSAAVGSGSAAVGSAAVGSGSAAVGSGSAAVGSGSAAVGSGSAAVGSGSGAVGSGSAAVGSGSAAVGSGSGAVGSGSAAVGSGSAAVGSGSAAVGSGSAAVGSGSGSAAPIAAPVPPPPPPPVVAPPVVETTIALSFPHLDVAFTNVGAAVRSWRLKDAKYQADDYKGEFMAPQVGRGALQVDFATSTFVMPPNAVWVGEQLSPTEVRYTFTGSDLKIVKTFVVKPDDFMLGMKVDVTAAKPGVVATQALALTTYAYQDPTIKPRQSSGRGSLLWRAACQVGQHAWTAPPKVVHDPLKANGLRRDNATWGGFAHGYLLQAMAPQRAPGEQLACEVGPGLDGETPVPGLMRVDLLFPPAPLTADAPLSRTVWTFIGPTHWKQLEGADRVAGYGTGMHWTTDFGWFGFIGKPLHWLMIKFHNFAGNWGLAIIMLTLVVKGATLWFTTRSMRSMKAMAALAPKMKELQERYKDDKQRIQVETMAMYKSHGVNPLAGCLPVLLQMPIWIALYRMLSSAGELYREPFIGGWIGDLTMPDPYHVLPVLLIVTMFAQAKLQPQTQTGFQAKLIMYGLPLGFGVAAFFFPSGLSLYIFTNTLISALHSIYMNKFDKKSLEIMARMKADEEAAKAAAEAAKAGKGGGKDKKAKAVIDASATEASTDGGDDADEAGAAGGSPGGGKGKGKKGSRGKRRT